METTVTIIRSRRRLRKRHPWDYYPTPPSIIRAILKQGDLTPYVPNNIVDVGAGKGEWGPTIRTRWPGTRLNGVELHHDLPESEFNYDAFVKTDYLTWSPGIKYDLCIGNPPFDIAEECVWKSREILGESGAIVFLLRLAFLESEGRYKRLFTEFRPKYVYISTHRISFIGNGKSDDTAYGIYIWHKSWEGPTELRWLNWTNH